MAHRAASAHRSRVTVLTAADGSLEITAVPIEPAQATLELHGAVDCITAGLVTTALNKQLAQGHRSVVLDLSRLTFLDCAGLGVLVKGHNDFLCAGGTLVLTGVGHRVARLLRLTLLDEALFITDGPGEPRHVRHLASVRAGQTQ